MPREWRDFINDTWIGTSTVLGGLIVLGFTMNTDAARRMWRVPLVGAALQSMTAALNHLWDQTTE
jgi:hypothetical protein